MTADDELGFRLVDDPAPPEPDVARLHRAVVRGRQRVVRRRALIGAVTAVVAFALVGGGVEVAGRNDSAPDVQIEPPTTVPLSQSNVREADANGLHYTLTLETPVVSGGGAVRISFHVENRTTRDVVTGDCGFTVDILPLPDGPNLVAAGSARCTGHTQTITAHSTFPIEDVERAPTATGAYAVVFETYASDALPPSFRLMKPFVLQVLPNGRPTSTTTMPNSSEPLGPSPTEGFTVPTTVAGAVQGEDPRTPHATDFSGTLTASATSVTVGEGVNFELNIRNITDHAVEPSLSSLTKGVAVVCANDLSPLGHTGIALRGDVNLFFVTSPSLAPLDPGGRGGTYTPTSSDVGVVTCAAVIIATTDHWKDGTISSVAQLANVPSVSFAVAAGAAGTTTSAGPSPTTSTATRSGNP